MSNFQALWSIQVHHFQPPLPKATHSAGEEMWTEWVPSRPLEVFRSESVVSIEKVAECDRIQKFVQNKRRSERRGFIRPAVCLIWVSTGRAFVVRSPMDPHTFSEGNWVPQACINSLQSPSEKVCGSIGFYVFVLRRTRRNSSWRNAWVTCSRPS